MEEEVLDGIGTGGEWESRAGLGGDIKRCHGCGYGGGDNSTARRRGKRDGRSDGEHKSEVHTVVVERKKRCPRLQTAGAKHIAVSNLTRERCLMTAGRTNEPVLPFPRAIMPLGDA